MPSASYFKNFNVIHVIHESVDPPLLRSAGKCSMPETKQFGLGLWARFLGLFWNENRKIGNDQNYWNMKQDKTRLFQKWTEN